MFLVDPVEHIKKYSNRLDKEMNEILADSKITESEKLSRYLTVLRRYIISKQQTSDPKSGGREEITSSTIQRKLTIPEITISEPAETTSEYPINPQQELRQQATKITLPENYEINSILKKIHHKYQKIAYTILGHLMQPDSSLKYSKTSGELLKNDKPIPGSNIYESLRHYVNKDPRSIPDKPEGHEHLIEYIKEIVAKDRSVQQQQKRQEQPQQQQKQTGQGKVRKIIWKVYR